MQGRFLRGLPLPARRTPLNGRAKPLGARLAGEYLYEMLFVGSPVAKTISWVPGGGKP